MSSLENKYSHLTNASINKFSPQYAENKTTIGEGSKWTLGRLRAYLETQNIDHEVLFRQLRVYVCVCDFFSHFLNIYTHTFTLEFEI